jgi:hypothetical protein
MHYKLKTLGTTLLLITSTICLSGCDEDPPTTEPSGVHYSQCNSMPQSATRSLDLLFVVDDSTAMAGFESRLRQNMIEVAEALSGMGGGLPDLHLGVVTTVLGTGPHSVDGCPLVGHEGQMRTGAGADPGGATYLKDVKPSGCTVQCPDATGVCRATTCTEENCDHEPGTWLVSDDATGCPRCRNYHGALADAFSDIANAGVSDCPFSQPLEAMKLALQNDANPGFLREDSYLAILFITAQDDCSASDTRLFDGADATLGPLSPFRCFEQGVTCDVNGREPGPRHDCVPRPAEDTESLMNPVSDYVTFLQGIKEPQLLVVAGVTGPFDGDDVITVRLDPRGDPRLAPSCTQDATMSASPGVRLHSLLAAFNEVEDLSTWAQTSTCDTHYTAALSGLHNSGCTLIEAPCFELPLHGCPDPGAAVGEPRDDRTCNDTCAPNCVITDVWSRGLPDETEAVLPPCLEVCADDPCPGNTDPTLAYANGRPAERDFRLPVPACWYVKAEGCTETSRLIVSRQADPPPRSFVTICCELVPEIEQTCEDDLPL